MSGGEISLFSLFREEVRSHTSALSSGLVALEADPANPQKIEPLMRAAHSLKGAARIVNIDPAVHLAHALEDILVAAQHGQIRLGPADMDVLLRATDVLASLAEVHEEAAAAWSEQNRTRIEELIATVRHLPMPATAPAPAPPVEQAVLPLPEIHLPTESLLQSDDFGLFDQFREEVRIHAGALRDGLQRLAKEPGDSAVLGPMIQAAHLLQGAARLVQMQPAARVCQAIETALTAVRDHEAPLGQAGVAGLTHAVVWLASLLDVAEESAAAWAEQQAGAVEQLLARPPFTAAVAVPAAPAPVPVPVREPAPVAAPPPSAAEEAVVRVTAESLNRLMSLAGESLVQARWLAPFTTALVKLKKQQDHLGAVLDSLGQQVTTSGPEQLVPLVAEARRLASRCRTVLLERVQEFEDHAGQAEDLGSRLYREVILSRMRPFADGAQGFPRLVRDAARRLGKQARLELDGQATPVDRDILEQLEAPLSHLLRNAVDHGLEPADRRQTLGKPEVGTVRIEARHRGGMLAITVSDDGRGIDPEALRQKVVERSLTTASVAQHLSEAELLEFLFLPGFSTAAEVTEFSGRGVGLDVVQTMVRQVGGSVRITTQPGRGSAFHLQLPITLSVLRAVLVEVGGEVYALPHNRIDRLLRVPRSAVQSLENCQYLALEGRNVGLVLASQVLELPAAPPSGGELSVVLVGDTSGHYGLVVDAFRGEQDLVVRPLDPRLGKVPDLSAAAILEDGSAVLILDVEDLLRSLERYIQSHTLQRCEPVAPGARQRKRVLVVDDSITVREVERQLLRTHGYDVTLAVDGQEGWHAVRGGRFDLVVTDVDMPRMNGFELVRAMRGEPALREVPVIVVSYKEREEDRLQGLAVGANYYLTKSSFHDDTFLRAVTDLIGEA
jgi:two-component system sensor histidine kinase and response regulator WspE